MPLLSLPQMLIIFDHLLLAVLFLVALFCVVCLFVILFVRLLLSGGGGDQ